MCVYVCVLENWELTLKLPPQCDLIIIKTLRHLRMYSREGHACTIMTSYLTQCGIATLIPISISYLHSCKVRLDTLEDTKQ